MTAKLTKPVTFVVNGHPVATLDKDGKVEPLEKPPVRVDQIDSRAEIGRQAWIVDTVLTGAGNPENK